MNEQHTPEPWIVERDLVRDEATMRIVVTRHRMAYTEAEANARRIVACVNALTGIPTAELEEYTANGGALHFDDGELTAVRAQRDELSAAFLQLKRDVRPLLRQGVSAAWLIDQCDAALAKALRGV